MEAEKYTLSQERIDELKKKHPKGIFLIEAEGHQAIVRTPTRHELGYAATVSKNDPLKFNDVILNKCWIEGDEEIRTDDRIFMAVANQLDTIVETAEASIKKL
jgi:hypothetical protein